MDGPKMEQFIHEVVLAREGVASFDDFPFNIPVVRQFGRMAMHPKATFFIGDNGCGKSTLLEAIAVADGVAVEGVGRAAAPRSGAAALAKALRLVRGARRQKTIDGFYLRTESFVDAATRPEQLNANEEWKKQWGGRPLFEQSQGESYLSLLRHRFRGNGLFLLDEPEAALSQRGQLGMLRVMHDLIRRGSQFVVATHSPILMAYPEAWIYEFSANGLRRVDYDKTDHHRILSAFLARREKIVEELLAEEDQDRA